VLYATGALLALPTFASPLLFDRYTLPLLPFLVVAALRSIQHRRPDGVMAWRWAPVVLLLAFAVVAQIDNKTKATLRWEAAEDVVEQGVLPEHVVMGTEWTGWMYYEKAVAYVRENNITDREALLASAYAIEDAAYIVGELSEPGYDVVRRIPYTAWLQGGQERAVLVLKRQ
jgi:hypothetical protein